MRCTALVAALLFCAVEAKAQRVADNAVKAADDAFGTAVGNERTGLYNPFEARGFSPVDAGNVRIEGLYFDQQTQLNARVSRGNTVRVGISAQSYAFPAPTGVADFNLRLPGNSTIVSYMIGGGPFDSIVTELDMQTPVTDKFAVGAGAGFIRYDNQDASKNNEWNAGALFRLTPSDATEVSGFVGVLEDCHYGQQMRIIPGGPWSPPRVKRHVFYGQHWTRGDCRDSNGGFLARWNISDTWRLRAGIFRSETIQKRVFGDFMRNVQPDGSGQHFIQRAPRSASTSYSGEVRLTKTISHNVFRHTIDMSARGRDVERVFGGAHTVALGPGRIGEQTWLSEMDFTFNPQTNNETKQAAVGVSYLGQWAQHGALTLGLQKVDYRRDTFAPNLPAARAESQPWLYNAAINIFVTPWLAAYSSYTRGLEETPTAPDSAFNRGEPMPTAITKQVDAGLRFTLKPGLNLVAGVFEVRKPYFTLDRNNVFGPFGAIRHRGIEASLAGQLFEGFNIVAGLVALEPRVSGDAVDRGVIGKIPVGVFPRSSIVQINYAPAAWNGFALEVYFFDGGGQRTTADNSFKTDGYKQLNLGVRRNWTLFGVPASFRFRVLNVFNAYDWNVNQSGQWFPRQPLTWLTNLALDFRLLRPAGANATRRSTT
ncbi:MAG: TonB-dependent receptor [Rhodospirillaceae bacterium]